MEWIIYKHTSPSGKVYIGQTKRGTLRWKGGKSAYASSKKLVQAIEKYSWKNFTHEIIESGILSQEEANDREIFWIEFYDSYKNGYNMTKGGSFVSEEVRASASKNIIQLDSNFDIITEFASITEAAQAVDVSPQGIGQCVIGNQSQAAGYYWALKSDYPELPHIKISKYNRAIWCYELQRAFDSIKEAAIFCDTAHSVIAKALTSKTNYACGYHWCFYSQKDTYAPPNYNREYNGGKAKQRKVICVEQKEIFDSLSDASKKYGISVQNLSQNCCKGHRTAKGLHFAYVDEYNNDWKPFEEYNTDKRKKVSSLKKKVYCHQTDTVYESATEAGLMLNIPNRSISRCCLGELKQTHGYTFTYEMPVTIG